MFGALCVCVCVHGHLEILRLGACPGCVPFILKSCFCILFPDLFIFLIFFFSFNQTVEVVNACGMG